jgi:hypothetical protein
MIGDQPTGRVPGVEISAVAHEGLTASIGGRPGRLAIVDEHGHVVAIGDDVAREALAVSVAMYRAMLSHHGHLRVHSSPITASGTGQRAAA